VADRKNELLGAFARLFASLPASRVPELADRVLPQAGVVNVPPPFWPDRILDFLERHDHWLSRFVFSNYRVPAPGQNLKPEAVQALASAGIQHSAKETILRDLFNNLE